MSELAGAAILAFTLLGCGGGSDSAQVSAQADQAAQTQQPMATQYSASNASTVKYSLPLSSTVSLYSGVPFTALDIALAKATTSAEMDAVVAKQAGLPANVLLTNAAAPLSVTAATTSATPPPACRYYRFTSPPGCLVVSPTQYAMPSGTTTADIAPVVPGCAELPTGGTKIDATPAVVTSPAVGDYKCYQFVFNANSTINSQIRVPSDFVGIAELFAVSANGLGIKVADNISPNNPFSLGATAQYYRAALVLRSGGGLIGAPMSVGIGVPAPSLVGVVNDDPSRPSVVSMNQTITTPSIPGGAAQTQYFAQSQYYYFYPTAVGQTSAELLVNFTTNQTVSVRTAQKTADGLYVLGIDQPLPASSAGVSKQINGLAANTAGSTIQNGLMVRVSSKTAGTLITDGFSLRVGVIPAAVDFPKLYNGESLVRLYSRASGLIQAYASMVTSLSVKDANGIPVAGEQVQFKVYSDELNGAALQTYTFTTDSNGQVNATLALPACAGSGNYVNHNMIFSYPGDYWIMKGQPGKVVASLPNRSPTETQSARFYKVCSETYQGQHSCASNSTDLWCKANMPWPSL